MNSQEIKKALLKAVEQFENEFPEWEDYNLLLKPDSNTVEILSDDGQVSPSDAKELIRDFLGTLKNNNLMVSKESLNKITITEYIYLVEDGLDDLADELESKFGKNIANLKVTEKDDKPYVRFRYIGNMTTDEQNKIKQGIVELTAQYQAVDEDDVFTDVEFDDFDDIMDDIKQDNLVDQIAVEDIEMENSDEHHTLSKEELEVLTAKDEDDIETYQVIIDNDAPVEYTREEILASVSEEDFEKLLSGETIEFISDEGEEFQVSLVLENKAEDTEPDSETTYYLQDIIYDYERHGRGTKEDYNNARRKLGLEVEDEDIKAEDIDDLDDLYIPHADKMISQSDILNSSLFEQRKILRDLNKGKIELENAGPENYEEDEYDFFLNLYGAYIAYVESEISKEDIKAEDMLTNILAKDSIAEAMKLPINEKTDKMIWDAFKYLDTAIETQDRDYAETLYNFIYAFDIEDAALDMGQYEDLLDKRESVRSRIDAIEDYKAADELIEEIEIDLADVEALSDLYDELYTFLVKINQKNYPGGIQDISENTILNEAFNEVDEYLTQFGPLDEDVPTTLAKLDIDQREGYVEIINKWMNYSK